MELQPKIVITESEKKTNVLTEPYNLLTIPMSKADKWLESIGVVLIEKK